MNLLDLLPLGLAVLLALFSLRPRREVSTLNRRYRNGTLGRDWAMRYVRLHDHNTKEGIQ